MAAYFWVGGTGTWSGTGNTQFAVTSGGIATASNPTNADTVTFDANSGTAATVTVTSTAVSLSTTINKADITILLSGSPTLCTAAGTLTLTAGTLNLAGFTLSTGVFSSSNSNVRTVTSGAGSFTLTGNNATLWQTGAATNLTYTTIPTVNATYSGATGTRTFSVASSGDRINLNITAGTDTISNTPTFSVNNYNFTGFAGTLANIATNIFGNLTLSTGMTVSAGANTFTFAATSGTSTITSNGKTMDFPVTFNGVGGTWQLQDAMTVGSSRTTTLTNGTLDLNNLTLTTGVFASSSTNTRTLAFGTGKIVITALNATIWNTDGSQNFTVTGTSRVEISGAGTGGQTRGIFSGGTGGTETNTPNFYITAGADNVSFAGQRKFGTIDFSNSGTSTFTGNFQSTDWTFTVYGNLVLTASVAGFTTSSTFTGPITFGSTSGTKSVTSAGKTYPVPLTFDGVGGTWLCTDALTTSGALTLTNGTLKLAAGTTSTVGSFVTTGTNMKYLLSSVPTFQAQISDASGTNTVTYLTIQDNYATGGATWNATSATNVDAGNNYGWTFSSVSASSAQITMGLRSFTQFRG